MLPDLDMDALFGDLLAKGTEVKGTEQPGSDEEFALEEEPPRFKPSPPETGSELKDETPLVPEEPIKPKQTFMQRIEERKRQPDFSDRHGSAKRRVRAYEAALGIHGRNWERDVPLSSVSGYHNEEKETEL